VHAKWLDVQSMQKLVVLRPLSSRARNHVKKKYPVRLAPARAWHSVRWDQYWALLVAKRIPQQAQRWYVTHVQDFLDAVQPNSLKDLSREEITGYLQQTSSQGKWQDWQFRQVVDALQLLLVDLAGVKAAQLVDWDYWREAGITVTLYHLH
jgi:hypothetical protein